MQTQTATVNPPVRFNQSAMQLPKNEGQVRLEANRYVFCVGDFLTAEAKRQLRDIGGWTGGYRVGPSETEGVPTMWRSNYIINKGVFTALETTAVRAGPNTDPKLPSVRKLGEDDMGNPILVREVLPGNDIQLLQDDSHREMGIVEITSLRDKLFNDAYSLNKRFFPELDQWLAGEGDYPELLNDFRIIISKVEPESDAEAVTQAEMLDSATRFQLYAQAQIEANRQAIMRGRTTDMGGYTFKWEQRTRLFAKQLGIALEDDNQYSEVKASGQVEDPLKAREIEAMEESNRIELEKLAILRKQFEADKKKEK